MPRLRSKRTGVIVNVPDDKVSQLGHRFEPVEQPKPARRTTRKKVDSDDE